MSLAQWVKVPAAKPDGFHMVERELNPTGWPLTSTCFKYDVYGYGDDLVDTCMPG